MPCLSHTRRRQPRDKSINRTIKKIEHERFCDKGILRADVREGENSVSVMLIVKGNVKDGKRPNLLWQETSRDFLEEHDEQKMYEALVQAVADCEADIFYKTSVAILQNRGVRYDFEENVHIE